MGAIPLTIQMQHDKPCMWVLFDERDTFVNREINIYGTGTKIPNVFGKYVGTFQVDNGNYVFHVFIN